jgi:hypothetical protein
MPRSLQPALGLFFLLLWLRWPEWGKAEKTASSSNKWADGCFLALAEAELRLLPLAGRGGEERKRLALADAGSGGSGSLFPSAWVRDTDGRPASSSPLSPPLLACRGGVGMRAMVGLRAASSRILL